MQPTHSKFLPTAAVPAFCTHQNELFEFILRLHLNLYLFTKPQGLCNLKHIYYKINAGRYVRQSMHGHAPIHVTLNTYIHKHTDLIKTF